METGRRHVAVVLVAHAVIATRDGWHCDEFYFVVTGRRLGGAERALLPLIVVEVRRITLPDGLENEETTSRAAIYRCSGPKGTWAQLWGRLSYLS